MASVDCGRKQEYLQETCKLLTEGLDLKQGRANSRICVSQGSLTLGLFSREGMFLSTYPRAIANTTGGLDCLTPLSDLHQAPQAHPLPASVQAPSVKLFQIPHLHSRAHSRSRGLQL
ncbi:hypothetical protein Q5P01_010247 [Channa striata]|uniref:Uncharacterized protein n=1 Tax=Channa striata TaxID=64152 RepID=A0AA88N146_CHASR|nr:hypothetical protein Q5P01_010247 [Channa striata]